MKPSSSQRGSAIIMLFVAIALFGALAYAFMQGSRSSTAMITDEQAKMYAQQIIGYGNDIKTTVKRLKLGGCEDTNISFENNVVTGYTNTNNPPDKCKVFNVNGGGIAWQKPPAPALDGQASYSAYGEYFFPDLVAVQGIGTDCTTPDCTELMIELPYLKKEVCMKLNSLLGITTSFGSESVVNHTFSAARKFTGTYDFANVSLKSIVGDVDTAFAGKSSGCYYRYDLGIAGRPYTYYQVLIAR